MKCRVRRTIKGMVLCGILFLGLTLQATRVEAAGNTASGTQVVAEATSNGSYTPVEHNRNYEWSANYYGYTITVKVDLKTLVRKEVAEYGPCNIDICKLICSCEEREKFESYLCENLIYADGKMEITVSNCCGVIYRCVKPIHRGVR